FGHEPLVKLPGSLEFVLLVKAAQGEGAVTAMGDLVARRICSVAPPNLAPLVVLARYPDVVRQPLIHPARRGMGQALEQFRAGQCDAVVLPTNFYNNILSDADRQGLDVLFRSEPLPNQAISVGPRVSEQDRARLVQLFTTTGEPTVQPVLQVFARNAERFVPASREEYEPYAMLLRGVIFGW
ncbi:MAG TPA: PhnD/SsuA/transferrin family substrate-binding protein, partial [Thioalkalivibrio sp.]|nr:PhnD/SsuA/transferrin family substrate-binding protein [Thioalkalivibrio sp.]